MKADQIIAFTLPTATILKSILFVCSNTLTILMLFARGSTEEVGILMFKNGFTNPSSAFDAFVLSITFAFSGALGALLIPHKPNLATFYALYSLASMAFALLLLTWGLYFSLTTTSSDQNLLLLF